MNRLLYKTGAGKAMMRITNYRKKFTGGGSHVSNIKPELFIEVGVSQTNA